MGHEDDRPGSCTQRGAGAREFNEQLPGMRKDVALKT
jgi:hypothetical protein